MATLSGLVELLKSTGDFRRTDCGNFKHSLPSVLTGVFCATMAGCIGARSIADYINDNFLILNRLISFPNGVPSHDTILRVLQNVNPQTIADILRGWAGIDKLDPVFLQTDGKSIRGSKSNGEKAAHIVTVYAGDFAASLLEQQVFEKQNEISAFEGILLAKKINFNGKTVTGDAMFCQKSFCSAITQSGGNWIFVLKKNHPTLYAGVEEYFAGIDVAETMTIPISGHGRRGTKTIRFSTDIDWILRDYDFTGLRCIAEITTCVTEKGKTTTSKQYLIGSVATLQDLFIPRSKHWSIESMHWILDTAFEEDRCRCRTGNSPLILNVFRKIAIFFFNQAKKMSKFKDHSIRRLIGRCKAKLSNLLEILAFV